MTNAIAGGVVLLLLGWVAAAIIAAVRVWGKQQAMEARMHAQDHENADLRAQNGRQQESLDILKADMEGLRSQLFAKREEVGYLKGQADTILRVLMKDRHAQDTSS